jgi:hypothetical protein
MIESNFHFLSYLKNSLAENGTPLLAEVAISYMENEIS